MIGQQDLLSALVGGVCIWPVGEGELCGVARVAAANILLRSFFTYWMMNWKRSWPMFELTDCETSAVRVSGGLGGAKSGIPMTAKSIDFESKFGEDESHQE